MAKRIVTRLSTKSIDDAISELETYKYKLPKKVDTLCKKLADMGAVKVSLGYARAIYTGEKDIEVSVESIPNGYAIKASGETVLIVEFGAGIRYGYGHPQASEFGMGPGTYPGGKGHWDDPQGWRIPAENGGGHTYGNPPAAVMYETANELRDEIYRIAREVFNSD